MASPMPDRKSTVRDGYDVLAEHYLAARDLAGDELLLLDEVVATLPDGAAVLDLGCGAGVPVSKRLAQRFRVTGVDISAAQIALARERVPGATFVQGDMTALAFAGGSFDAIISLYAIIHVPREEHPALLQRLRHLLKPGGQVLLSLGASDNPDDVEENWLGGGAPMYWSHYDRETNLRLLREAGFTILDERVIMEDESFGGGGHLFVRAVGG